jgi:hypothetical protein
MLMATGNFGEALELINQRRQTYPWLEPWLHTEIHCHVLAGNEKAARDAIDRACSQQTQNDPDPSIARKFRNRLETHFAYCAGNIADYVSFAQTTTNVAERLRRHITRKDVTAARQAVDEMTVDTPYAHLLIYIAAALQGDKDVAEQQMKQAVGDFDASPELQQMAAYLGGDRPIDPDAVCSLVTGHTTKAICLAALGVKFPEHRERFFALAEKLHCVRTFPYWFLHDLFDAGTEKKKR